MRPMEECLSAGYARYVADGHAMQIGGEKLCTMLCRAGLFHLVVMAGFRIEGPFPAVSQSAFCWFEHPALGRFLGFDS